MFDLVVFVNILAWLILIFDEFKNLLCKGKGDCDTQGMFFLFEKVLCKGTEGRDSLVFSPKRQDDVQEWEARNVNWRKWPINSSRILFSFSGPSVFRKNSHGKPVLLYLRIPETVVIKWPAISELLGIS